MYWQPSLSWRTFLSRTTVDPNVLWKTIEQQVKVVDPTVSIAVTGTLEGSLTDFYRGPEFELALFGFAAADLILVVIGVYSVVAYAVSLRTREIGIRTAMGAQKPDILYLVLAHTLYRAAAGITIGLLGSYALTRSLASQISGVSVTDTWTFAAVALATIIPGHRAISVDPAVPPL